MLKNSLSATVQMSKNFSLKYLHFEHLMQFPFLEITSNRVHSRRQQSSKSKTATCELILPQSFKDKYFKMLFLEIKA
jgi:hypothetical protein